MTLTQTKPLFLVVIINILFLPLAYATNGYFSDGYGAKSRGMGGAGMALPQETGSILQNPAAAVHIGDRLDASLGLFSPSPRSTLIENNDVGLNGHYISDRDYFFIPFYGQSFKIDERSSWAMTLSALGGMNTDYPVHPFDSFHPGNAPASCPSFPVPCASFGSMGIDLKQAQIAASYAVKVTRDLSFGATLGLIIQQFQAKGLEPFAAFSTDMNKITGTGKSLSTGFGLNLGVQYDMANGVSVAAQYAPSADMSEFDEYAGLFAEQGDFDIPSHYSVGIAWQATSNVTLALDYRRINYTDVASISNDAQRLTDFVAPSCINPDPALNDPSTCLGGANGAGFGWSDQDIYKLGVAIDQGNGFTYRIGWNHGDSPVKSEDAVIDAIAPATTEDHLTLGLTRSLDSSSELTLDFIRTFENSVKGGVPLAFSSAANANPTPSPGTSTLSMAQYFFEINYARRF